jgi:conjugal transfer mating pair stabilization protein TraN
LTKLARVFQEEARQQLGLDWGKPKDPNCRGLYISEIEKIDFTKLDLREVYEHNPQELERKLQDKLRQVEDNIINRIKT